MSLIRYGRAELSLSDHKPVYAMFKAKIRKVNEEAKAFIEESLIQKFNVLKHNQTNPVSPQPF